MLQRQTAEVNTLAGPLQPLIAAMTESTDAAIAALDAIVVWDAADVSHEALLKSIDELRTHAEDWQNELCNRLAASWMEQAGAYNTYRRKVEKTLRARHAAELSCLCPSLRATQNDVVSPIETIDEDMRAVFKHMLSFGFRVPDTSGEGSRNSAQNAKIKALAERQIRERGVLDAATIRHGERLIAAKRADLDRLRLRLKTVVNNIKAVAQAAERKVEASKHVSAHTVYRRPLPKAQGNGRQFAAQE